MGTSKKLKPLVLKIDTLEGQVVHFMNKMFILTDSSNLEDFNEERDVFISYDGIVNELLREDDGILKDLDRYMQEQSISDRERVDSRLFINWLVQNTDADLTVCDMESECIPQEDYIFEVDSVFASSAHCNPDFLYPLGLGVLEYRGNTYLFRIQEHGSFKPFERLFIEMGLIEFENIQ